MAKDWHDYLKKYIWDEEKTPFLVAVDRLHKSQAHNEIFLYALFLSVPAALVAAAAVASSLRYGVDLLILVGLYGASVCVAAAWLYLRKSRFAAIYSVSVPLVLLAYLLWQGFHPRLGALDQMVIVVVLLLWLRYTVRIHAIVRRYASMPERPRPS